MSGPSKKPRVDLDATRERLDQLGLSFALEALGPVLEEAVKQGLSGHQVLDRLLEEEIQRREEKRIKRCLKLSGLPIGQTLANFDFAFQPSIERTRIETLATCQYVKDCATILLQGPPGVGKTHLAVALGVKAIENGFSVAFFRLSDLLYLMRKDKDLPPQRLRRKKHMSVSVVIVDEIGFEPMSREDASLFFRLVSYRYMRGATIITTNKSVRSWPEVLAGDEVLATAILDRLLHRCHVLNVKGRSYRLRDLEQQIAKRA